ncbi:hypothetical protein FV218_11870 [Methylobacterium sp. WL69]|uniref:hypothetical protein n=1 Tax=Methylobacterium sp. WL69 TaxID=2603893 RepID=UPI0011C9FB68|nr:hypothetical protein [Methylobacterium sp. WL69]TXM73120.1 hypothetical protein FV218_11870 [Methylobacterium sp. WL69]
MFGPDVLADFRDQLGKQIASRPQLPAFDPLPVSPWIAMSLLQKAIRRGLPRLALQAAARLLTDSPERLWRRCGGIAFEDVGAADPETVGLVTAALGGKRIRVTLGGEWQVASFIVEAMAEAPKCRGADDLLMSVELHPDLTQARQTQAELSVHQLRRIVLSQATLQERALALWYVLGTDRRPSRHLRAYRGEPTIVFDLLDELGTPPTMVEIAREGFRRTREVLCPFVGMLMADRKPKGSSVEDDDLPEQAMIGPVPGWALDIYTREGRAALNQFGAGETNTAKWVRDRIPPAKRLDMLGGILFRVEGGLVARRLRWPIALELRRLLDIECQGLSPSEAVEVLTLIRSDVPSLNEIRAAVMGSVRHAL